MQITRLISIVKVKYAKSSINKKTGEESMCSECDPCRGNAATCSECNPCRGNATQAFKCDPCQGNAAKCSECDPVKETPHKRSNETPVEETTPICSKDVSCRQNRVSLFRMRLLSHKLHLSRQNAKYCRNRIENEHRICNHRFICEILQNSHWERT